MILRRFDRIGDVDDCVDLFVSALNALSPTEQWNLKAAEHRLEGVLESPVFCGWVGAEGGKSVGMILGVFSYWLGGKGYEVLEIFTAPGADRKTVAKDMFDLMTPWLKAEGVSRVSALTNELWRPDFFAGAGYEEVSTVRLYRRSLD